VEVRSERSWPSGSLAILALAASALACNGASHATDAATAGRAHDVGTADVTAAGDSAAGENVSEAGSAETPCSLVNNRDDLSFLTSSGGCPATLETIAAGCTDHVVQEFLCAGYIQVTFEPLPPSTGPSYRSNCFYAVDTQALLGGSMLASYSEDPAIYVGGQTPVNCSQTCAPAIPICAPPGIPGSADAAID
jgi:hypothetical protein